MWTNLEEIIMNSYINQSIDGYQILSVLGSGAFGKVYKAFKYPQWYAIKKINIGSRDFNMIMKEVTIHQGLSHDNIVKCYGHFSYDYAVWIVMEYCIWGTLNSFLLNQPQQIPDILLNYINQIFVGVEYLHSQKVIHRDLKPDNIMVSIGGPLGFICKITDFGLARKLGDSIQSLDYNFNYNPNFPSFYSAPELKDGKMTLESDIFSLGCLVIAMFSRTTLPGIGGKPILAPYITINNTNWQLFDVTDVQKRYYINMYIGCNEQLQNLVFNMVQHDWQKRPNAKAICQELNNIRQLNALPLALPSPLPLLPPFSSPYYYQFAYPGCFNPQYAGF